MLHIINRLMHVYSSHITLLTLCHFDMVLPSNGHLQGVEQIHFNRQVDKII